MDFNANVTYLDPCQCLGDVKVEVAMKLLDRFCRGPVTLIFLVTYFTIMVKSLRQVENDAEIDRQQHLLWKIIVFVLRLKTKPVPVPRYVFTLVYLISVPLLGILVWKTHFLHLEWKTHWFI